MYAEEVLQDAKDAMRALDLPEVLGWAHAHVCE